MSLSMSGHNNPWTSQDLSQQRDRYMSVPALLNFSFRLQWLPGTIALRCCLAVRIQTEVFPMSTAEIILMSFVIFFILRVLANFGFSMFVERRTPPVGRFIACDG